MPNQTKISSPWPNYLKVENVANHQLATAELAQLIAGRNRYLYEMLIGASAFANEAPSIPQNPQGNYGVDNSGAPYGVALRHPLVSLAYAEQQAGSTQYFSVPLTNAQIAIPLEFYVRPFSQYTGTPYSEAASVMRIYNGNASTVNLTATVQLNGKIVEFWNLAGGGATSFAGVINTTDTIPIRPGRNSGRLLINTNQFSGVELLGFALANFEKIRH